MAQSTTNGALSGVISAPTISFSPSSFAAPCADDAGQAVAIGDRQGPDSRVRRHGRRVRRDATPLRGRRSSFCSAVRRTWVRRFGDFRFEDFRLKKRGKRGRCRTLACTSVYISAVVVHGRKGFDAFWPRRTRRGVRSAFGSLGVRRFIAAFRPGPALRPTPTVYRKRR